MEITKEIFINSTIGSTRVAILENKHLSDLHIERPDHKRMVGNIYKGKVQNVIPGMQAAFIDIGYNINSFLPFTEIIDENSLSDTSFDKQSSDIQGIKSSWFLIENKNGIYQFKKEAINN